MNLIGIINDTDANTEKMYLDAQSLNVYKNMPLMIFIVTSYNISSRITKVLTPMMNDKDPNTNHKYDELKNSMIPILLKYNVIVWVKSKSRIYK